MFNKGQLAGLMKQAQAMQDNLKKAQDELDNVEVRRIFTVLLHVHLVQVPPVDELLRALPCPVVDQQWILAREPLGVEQLLEHVVDDHFSVDALALAFRPRKFRERLSRCSSLLVRVLRGAIRWVPPPAVSRAIF